MGTSAEREVLAIPVVEMCSGEKELQVAIIKKWPYCNKDWRRGFHPRTRIGGVWRALWDSLVSVWRKNMEMKGRAMDEEDRKT